MQLRMFYILLSSLINRVYYYESIIAYSELHIETLVLCI